jgi:hypothetical protein
MILMIFRKARKKRVFLKVFCFRLVETPFCSAYAPSANMCLPQKSWQMCRKTRHMSFGKNNYDLGPLCQRVSLFGRGGSVASALASLRFGVEQTILSVPAPTGMSVPPKK